MEGYVKWHELKKAPQLAYHWHGAVTQSESGTGSSSYAVDECRPLLFRKFLI